jgi:hypothetical protein
MIYDMPCHLPLPSLPLAKSINNQALEFQLVEIAHQVQRNSMRSKAHPGGGATHQLQDIPGIAAPLHALTANILEQRKLTGGCTAKDIQVTEVFSPKYECMGAPKEYHWDAKGSTDGSFLIRIGEGDYIGGDTFMGQLLLEGLAFQGPQTSRPGVRIGFLSFNYVPPQGVLANIILFLFISNIISVVYFPCSCLFISVSLVLVCLEPKFVCLFPLRAPTSHQPHRGADPHPHPDTRTPFPISHMPHATWDMGHGKCGSGIWHLAHGHLAHGDMGKSKTRQRASQRNWRNQLLYVFNCFFRAKIRSKR